MINQEQAIPCPSCNTKIPFDVYQLLAGAKFTCPTCYASIGLPTESKGIVQETIGKFDKVKGDILKMKKDNSMS